MSSDHFKRSAVNLTQLVFFIIIIVFVCVFYFFFDLFFCLFVFI